MSHSYNQFPSAHASSSSSSSSSSMLPPNRGAAVKWTLEMKRALLKTLYDTSVSGGLRSEFLVWQSASDAVNAVSAGGTAQTVTPVACQSKSDSCKRDWRAFALFQGKPGWTYTDEGVPLEPRGIIDAWFIRHENSQKYRSKPIAFRAWHEEIYRDGIATTIREDAGSSPPGYGSYPYLDQGVAKDSEVQLAESRLGKNPPTMGEVLDAQLRALNAVLLVFRRSRSNTQNSDPQSNTIALFHREFSALSFEQKDCLVDLFESPFNCKRFFVAASHDRIEWLKARIHMVCTDKDDQIELRAALDDLEGEEP